MLCIAISKEYKCERKFTFVMGQTSDFYETIILKFRFSANMILDCKTKVKEFPYAKFF